MHSHDRATVAFGRVLQQTGGRASDHPPPLSDPDHEARADRHDALDEVITVDMRDHLDQLLLVRRWPLLRFVHGASVTR